jgi:hypothetical protein
MVWLDRLQPSSGFRTKTPVDHPYSIRAPSGEAFPVHNMVHVPFTQLTGYLGTNMLPPSGTSFARKQEAIRHVDTMNGGKK